MNSNMPHKYILVGASGTSKTTMAESLEELGLKRCITCTTRPPRPGEVMKDSYYFESSFDGLDMFEQAEFGGYQYGITKDELEKGDFVILEPQGVDYYRKNYPGPLTVISLSREGIQVDPERRARDAGAGFDKVDPDITVHGETIEEMRDNLYAALFSYEAKRLLEAGTSPLSEYFLQDSVRGSMTLFFSDSEFGLPVSASQYHLEYREYPNGYDGLSCFEAADYERLFEAFQCMAQRGDACCLDLYVQKEDNKTLYFSRVQPEERSFAVEIYPEYLNVEPYRFVTESAADAINMAYGGFLAANIDCLGKDQINMAGSKVVEMYRTVLSEGRFELHAKGAVSRKPSLDSKIHAAEDVRKVHLEKLFPFQEQSLLSNQQR